MTPKRRHFILATLLFLCGTRAALASSPSEITTVQVAAAIESSNIRIEFDQDLRSHVLARFAGKEKALGPFSCSETVVTTTEKCTTFKLLSQKTESVSDQFGKGRRLVLTGGVEPLRKVVSVTIYDDFPSIAVFDVEYTNKGARPVEIHGWSNQAYSIEAGGQKAAPAFWSYQSGSYEKRPNWILPLHPGFHQENYLGMNASDYGGATAVIDVWRRDVGIAVGHVEPVPRLVSLPVSMPDATHAHISVRSSHGTTLAPQESFHTLRTFVAVHTGDYYQALAEFRRLMQRQGFQMASAPESAFGPIWCAWGYGDRKSTCLNSSH